MLSVDFGFLIVIYHNQSRYDLTRMAVVNFHYIRSAGPLAKIDQATAVATEREVLVPDSHFLLTSRALQLDFALAGHTSIVVEEGVRHQ